MHHEQARNRTPGGSSSIESLGVQQPGPGKRTLTESVTVQRRAAAAGSGAGLAATGAAASAPSLLESPASSGARPTLQMLFGHRPAAAGDSRDQALPSDGGGHAMPEDVRAKMESAFGADFSEVRIHEGARAAALGARAYTQGADVHFAPGGYQPHSSDGQELLGHELTHVVQQRAGRVQATTQAKGVGVNDDSALEREADEMGARAARGEPVGGAPPAHASQGSAAGGGATATGAGPSAPVQRVPIGPNDLETTNPLNRQAILNYIRSCGPQQLADILQRMRVENHPSNTEYIQILHKELERDQSLIGMDQIVRQHHGVWTSAKIFHEKALVYSTDPAKAGDVDTTDDYGVGMDMHESHEHGASVLDSEVSTIAQIEQHLQTLLQGYPQAHIGSRVDILVTGNMGPCDGCKDRLQRFVATCRQSWRGVNFDLEVNYTTRPNDVRRQGLGTTYGDHNDGSRTSPSGIGYYHHNY
jgi:hypothetical protein